MKSKMPQYVITFVASLSFLFLSCGSTLEKKQKEENEIERVESRFNEEKHKAIISEASWSLIHVGEKDCNRLLETVLIHLKGDGTFSFRESVNKAGGIEEYKKLTASFLKSDEEIVRGFAAILLGIIGDLNYAQAILDVINAEDLPVKLGIIKGIDKAQCFIALALMDDKKYKSKIKKYVNDDNRYIRSYAKRSLMIFEYNLPDKAQSKSGK